MYQRPLTMTKARSRSNPSKEPPASSKVPYEDLKDIDIQNQDIDKEPILLDNLQVGFCHHYVTESNHVFLLS